MSDVLRYYYITQRHKTLPGSPIPLYYNQPLRNIRLLSYPSTLIYRFVGIQLHRLQKG